MNYSKILRQAWKNVISYRALWIFGVVLALTTASTSSTLFSQSRWEGDETLGGIMGTGVTMDLQPGDDISEALGEAFADAGEELRRDIQQADSELTRFYRNVLGLQMKSDILNILTMILWAFVLFLTVGSVARYVSDTALIKMVDGQEQTGEQSTTRDGIRMGWSRTAWRLFLIELLINIPIAITFIVLFAIVFAPLLLWGLGISAVGWLGVVFSGGLFFLFIFLAIVVQQVVRVLKYIARRVCALEGAGVVDSVRRAYRVLKGNLKEVGLTWLILVGVNIGWPLVLGIIAVMLIAVAVVVGGGLGLLIGLTANAFGAANPAVTGAIVGIPLFLLILVTPLLLLEGLKEIFVSSTWTLTYRELQAMAGLEGEALPEPIASEGAED